MIQILDRLSLSLSLSLSLYFRAKIRIRFFIIWAMENQMFFNFLFLNNAEAINVWRYR